MAAKQGASGRALQHWAVTVAITDATSRTHSEAAVFSAQRQAIGRTTQRIASNGAGLPRLSHHYAGDALPTVTTTAGNRFCLWYF